MLEARAHRGERGLDVLEALHGLGAKIARRTGELSIRRHAELAGKVDGAARAFGFNDMRVTARSGMVDGLRKR